ncbi:MAG: hypothetical protein A3A73_04050 [Omnitrophica bacterium RIFCSPLOWO2_01_FULL_50_24]|nr:MAG: hypothetical protein A3A73_04050 [Omnitrophica bacterium RIFCSPLOWO2_01_FULL_50_24]
MDELGGAGKLGIKIERPMSERLGFFYYFLVIVSFLFMGFTVWLLVIEWTGMPFPEVFRSLIPS